MDAVWIQVALGALGSMVLGVATNLITPIARRGFGRVVRRLRPMLGRIMSMRGLRGVRRRIAAPVRRLAAAVRA